MVRPPNAMIRTPASAGEEQDAVREHEPVAAVRELAGQVPVAGDDRRQPGEVGVGGVGGERQDRGGRELQDTVHRTRCRTRAGPSARTPSGRGSGTGARRWASTDTPKNSVPRMSAHPHQRRGRVLRLRPAERGHAVGDRLDAGERDGARARSPSGSGRAPSVPPTSSCRLLERLRVERDVADVAERSSGRARSRRAATSDHDVDVGGHREDAARLLDPAQVGELMSSDQERARARRGGRRDRGTPGSR